MRFQVVLKKSDEGYAAWCPALRGCNSQGQTEAEALTNIREAISEYLTAVDEVTARNRESDETIHVVETQGAARAEAARR